MNEERRGKDVGIKINMSGVKIGGNADVMNGISINGNVESQIDMNKAEIGGNIRVLNDAEIHTVLFKLEEQLPFVDRNTNEYAEIQRILNEDHSNQKRVSERIAEHVGNFATGVLANIVSGLI